MESCDTFSTICPKTRFECEFSDIFIFHRNIWPQTAREKDIQGMSVLSAHF